MTSIKPSSGPVTTLPHTIGGVEPGPASPLGAPEAPDRHGELQRTTGPQNTGDLSSVSQSHATASDVASRAAGSLGASHSVNLVDLARAVESGQLTMGQAVERLVEGTLGSLPRQLTELERTELSQLLRQALQNDPTLRGLQDEPA